MFGLVDRPPPDRAEDGAYSNANRWPALRDAAHPGTRGNRATVDDIEDGRANARAPYWWTRADMGAPAGVGQSFQFLGRDTAFAGARAGGYCRRFRRFRPVTRPADGADLWRSLSHDHCFAGRDRRAALGTGWQFSRSDGRRGACASATRMGTGAGYYRIRFGRRRGPLVAASRNASARTGRVSRRGLLSPAQVDRQPAPIDERRDDVPRLSKLSRRHRASGNADSIQWVKRPDTVCSRRARSDHSGGCSRGGSAARTRRATRMARALRPFRADRAVGRTALRDSQLSGAAPG